MLSGRVGFAEVVYRDFTRKHIDGFTEVLLKWLN